MHLSKYLHSCLLVEDGGPSTELRASTRILVDPGYWTFGEGAYKPDDFPNIAAIFVTHSHADHMDVAGIKTIVERTGAKVYGNRDAVDILAKNGVVAELFDSGEKRIGSITVEAFPADHEFIIANIPQNTAYLFNKQVLATGDSMDKRLAAHKGVSVLAAGVMAPWANQMQVVEFAKLLAPKTFLPLHDGYVKDDFRKRQYEQFAKHFAGFSIAFHPLEPGESLEV